MRQAYKYLAQSLLILACRDLAAKMVPPRRVRSMRSGEYRDLLETWKNAWWRSEPAMFLCGRSPGFRHTLTFWCQVAGLNAEAIMTRTEGIIHAARNGQMQEMRAQLSRKVRAFF
jgi:hypothetical protein